MNTNLLAAAARLSDDALLARIKLLAQNSRELTVELIAHLAEIANRKLHRREGPGRLFGYCTEVLRFSEAAAYNRIKAVRAVRKFPVILDLLAEGSVNLTTVRLLVPHLTLENHQAVLSEAKGMKRRQVDKLVARLSPKPDVAPSIRKLPTPVASAALLAAAELLAGENEKGAPAELPPGPSASAATIERPAPAAPALTIQRPVVAPLSPDRYRVQFTVGKETEEQLRRLQDLLRAEIPDGDPGAIFARALPLLLREAEKKKFAATSTPRPGRGMKPGSRHVPAAVERRVWRRDSGQCAFVATNGRRCTERSYLEFHHCAPYGLGGEATVRNISLRCRAHNAYESELVFGPYDPSCVRETSAVYAARSGGANWSRDQFHGSSHPREGS